MNVYNVSAMGKNSFFESVPLLAASQTAARRTTKHSMNVYNVSAMPASIQLYLPAGPKLLNSPKAAVAQRAAVMPPASCDTMYIAIVFASMVPFMKSASETAGLKFAPETDPSAKIATINEDAMERTAQVALPVRTFAPTVPTRMKVPRNSEMQFLTSALTIVKCVKGAFNFDQLTASLRLA